MSLLKGAVLSKPVFAGVIFTLLLSACNDNGSDSLSGSGTETPDTGGGTPVLTLSVERINFGNQRILVRRVIVQSC